MARLIKKVSKMVGLPPGTVIHIGDSSPLATKITVFDYDQNNYQEKELKTLEECFPFRDSPTITWINVDGIQDVDIIERIDQHFGIHPLVLEDIVNTAQRPKIEDYAEYIFIVFKMLYVKPDSDEILSEHVSLILGTNYVISFQETAGDDVFNTIRDRIRNYKGRVRKMGADYLAYALLDCIVDQYFVILEKVDERIEKLEERLAQKITPEMSTNIHALKRDMIFLRKQIWPLREVISGFQRLESKLIKKITDAYMRDLYDHTIQVIDTVESFRDMLSSMQDVYLSYTSNRLNEIMKVLTIISTVFMPLNFIVGVYGMNFKYMPELEWRWGYYDILAVICIISIAMLVYFRRQKWL